MLMLGVLLAKALIINSESQSLKSVVDSLQSDFNYEITVVDSILLGHTKAAANKFDMICTHTDKITDAGMLVSLRNSDSNQDTPIIAFTGGIEESLSEYSCHTNVYFLEEDLSPHALQCRLHNFISPTGMPAKKIELNPESINLFVEASQDTFMKMTSSNKTTASSPEPLINTDTLAIDVSGYALIQSQSLQGFFSICFPKDTFLNTVNKMLGCNLTELDPDYLDAANELVNIIYGQVKKQLTFSGFSMNQISPKNTLNAKVINQFCSTCATQYIPFESDHGKFYIIIGIHEKGKQESVVYANAG